MAHRGHTRELFSFLCLALMVEKSEKKTRPIGSIGYIIDTADAINDYRTDPDVTKVPLSPAPPTGVQAFLISMCQDLFSLLCDQAIEIALGLALMLALMLIGMIRQRIVKIGTDAYRRVRGLRLTKRATEGDDSHNTHAVTDKVDENSQSPVSQATVTVLEVLDKGKEPDENSRSPASQIKTAVPEVHNNGQEIDENPRSPSSPSAKATAVGPDHEQKTVENRPVGPRATRRAIRLTEQQQAANRRVSDAMSPRAHEKLKSQLDTMRDELNSVKKQRQDVLDELQAEKARTEALANQQAVSPVIATTEDNQRANEERIATLEQEAVVRAQEVQAAETKVQRAEATVQEMQTKAQAAETKAQRAEATVQEMQTKAQDAVTREQGAESKVQELEGDVRGANTSAQEAETRAQRAERRLQELEGKTQGVETRAQRAEASVLEMQTKVQNAETNAQEAETQKQSAERRVQDLESCTQAIENRAQEAETKAQRAENQAQSLQQDLNAAQGLYDQGYQAAVTQAEATHAELIKKEKRQVQDEVNAAIAARDAEWQAHFDASVQKAVTDREATLTEAVTTAQNEQEAMRIAACNEWERAEKAEKKAEDEKKRADEEHEEVEKYKKGKLSQDTRIKAYTTDIARLKALTKHAEMNAAELKAIKDDQMRAQAIIHESIYRHYDVATKRVLMKLLSANDKINNLKELLKRPSTESSQINFLRLLLDAEINVDMYMSLDQAYRQVLVRQCKAVNARLDELKTIINKKEEPDMKALLLALYQPRGDEFAQFDDADSSSEPSSDEDEDVKDASVQSSARQQRVPSSRQQKAQATPLPSDPRPNNELKRKGSPDDGEAEASNKRKDASQMAMRMEMRPIAGPSRQQGSSSPEVAAYDIDPERQSQNEVPLSEPPVHHSTSPDPTTLSEMASHVELAPHPKPTKIPGPRPKPHFTASERQERLRYRHDLESEPASPEEQAPPSSIPAPSSFSFSAPKNIASAVIDAPSPTPNHAPIFKGLSLLSVSMANKEAMTNKKAALPGLPPPDEDDVIDFGSSAVTEDRASDGEPEDRFLAHSASDNEEDDEVAWEDTLYSSDRDDEDLDVTLNTHNGTSRPANTLHTPNWLDDDPSIPVRNLDMTEQNYEEQATEFAARAQGTQPAPVKKNSGPQDGEEELEDTFSVDLD